MSQQPCILQGRTFLVASSPSMRRALVHLHVGRMRIAFVELAQALCMSLGFSDASGVDFWLALILYYFN